MIKVENMHCSVSCKTSEDLLIDLGAIYKALEMLDAAELWAYAPIKSIKLGVTEDDKNNIGDRSRKQNNKGS